jgi:heme/copper-type cytochrome/quinol oxidase subunit 2
MEGVYTKDPNSFKKWTAEQEQADQKRELAREAAAQAKALSDQANRLEGKPAMKGKKKGQS